MPKFLAALLLLVSLCSPALANPDSPTRVHIYSGTFVTLIGTLNGAEQVDRGECVIVYDENDPVYRITYSYRHSGQKLFFTFLLDSTDLSETQTIVKAGLHRQQFTDTFVNTTIDQGQPTGSQTNTLFILSGPVGTSVLVKKPTVVRATIAQVLEGTYIVNTAGSTISLTRTNLRAHLQPERSQTANNNGETGAAVSAAIENALLHRGFAKAT